MTCLVHLSSWLNAGPLRHGRLRPFDLAVENLRALRAFHLFEIDPTDFDRGRVRIATSILVAEPGTLQTVFALGETTSLRFC